MMINNNKTPYPSESLMLQGKTGSSVAVTMIKATFSFSLDGDVEQADYQEPIFFGDEYWGEPGKTSLRYASDLVPEKKGTDIALNGHVYSPMNKPSKKINTVLKVGKISKTVTVWGDRFWQFSMGMVSMTRPALFTKMPLRYERAFGGEDRFHEKESKWGVCSENPIGTGFRVTRKKIALDQLKLPNIETYRHPMNNWNDKPKPGGFGFIAPFWQPRASLCGTFDDAWKNERMPLLPENFDPGFYNAAPPDLISTPHLKGNESVFLKNLHAGSDTVTFNLPGIHFSTSYIFKHQTYKKVPVLDTLIIEPDENRFIMVFRSHYDGPEKLSHLIQVNVHEEF